MIYRQWPYTDFQQQNLDWLISKMKEYMDKVDAEEIKIQELKEYIDQFIDSVDVQTYVNNYIDYLVDQGYFNNMLSETMVSKDEIPNCLNGSLFYTRCFDATTGNIAQVNGGMFVPNYGYVCAVRALDSSRTTLLIIDTGSDTILQTYDVTAAFGHANSFAWTPDEPDKVYCISGSMPLASIDLTDGTTSVGLQTGYQACFCGPDNKIYLVTSSGQIDGLDGVTLMNLSYSDPILQDAIYYNGSILMLSDTALYQYSYIDGHLIASTVLPDKIGGRYLGEAENLTVDQDAHLIAIGSYLRNVLPQNPSRSALRIFAVSFVNYSDHNNATKPASVDLYDADELWLNALDYRKEAARFNLDPNVTFHFASFLEGRFALRSQTTSQATVKGAYVRDAHLDSEYVDYDLDPNVNYTGDIVSLYSDVVLGRIQKDTSIQNTQSTFQFFRTASYVASFTNPTDPIIYAPNARTSHTPFANVGTEYAYSGSHGAGKLDLDLSAWFDDRPPVMFLTVTLSNSDGYFARTEPMNKIEMGGTGTCITIATPSGVFTNQYSADATGITTESRSFVSYDGQTTTPPGGIYPVLAYVYHL